MAISRRDWLKGTTAATATAMVGATGCSDGASEQAVVCSEATDPLPSGLPTDTYAGPTGPATMFQHGVASGDPLTDRVILWTRVSTGAAVSVDVFYEVALDTAFTKRVAAGTVTTDATKDFTVKVDATGLVAERTYYYRFRCMAQTSPAGRTKTLPAGDISHLRLAMASCANYAYGYFHIYKHIAARADLDAVIFLGDYIYEYGPGQYPPASVQVVGREWLPAHEILTLDDYRTRYKLYRSDPDLREAHRQHPWICTWDDHEVANDTYLTGAENHTEGAGPGGEGSFVSRRAAAIQAYYEYLPIRGVGGVAPMYRNFRFGSLAEVIVLDTRHEGRAEQLLLADLASDSPARTMISATQESFLTSTLDASTSTWKLIAQQVMVAPYTTKDSTKEPTYMDQWDGYPAARTRLYDTIEQHGGGNIVVLTGDIHASLACDLARDPFSSSYNASSGAGSIAVEFVCAGVSSPGIGGVLIDGTVMDVCPHVKFMDSTLRGYIVLDIRPGKVQSDYFVIDGIEQTEGVESWMTSFAVRDGRPHLVEMNGPESEKNMCDPAP